MPVKPTPIILAALLLGTSISGTAPIPSHAEPAPSQKIVPRGPFAEVPREHWAYDAVQMLAQVGLFTGYPDGTFAGRKALTRYEFAVAVQRMLTEVQRDPFPLHRSEFQGLLKLVAEFASELAMLGADVEQIERNLQALRYRAHHVTWDLGEPNRYEYALDGGAINQPVRDDGARRAAGERQRGEVVLYSWDAVTGPQVSRRLGISYRRVAGEFPKAAELELIAGHNAEVIRLIEVWGLPRDHRLAWMGWIQDPEAAWRTVAGSRGEAPARCRPVARLKEQRAETVSPDGAVLVRLETGARRPVTLRLTLPSRSVTVAFTRIPAARQEVSLAWGPAGSDLLLLQSPLGEASYRYSVLDLRSGKILNGVDR